MSAISLIQPDRDFFLAAVLGRLLWPGAILPMSREEMDQLGWDSCDIIPSPAMRMSTIQASNGDLRTHAGSAGIPRRDYFPA